MTQTPGDIPPDARPDAPAPAAAPPPPAPGPPEAIRRARPQRPRPAPPQAAWPEPPNAWQRNPPSLALLFLGINLALYVYACVLFSRLTTGEYLLLARLSGDVQKAPLGRFMLEQISIYQVPTQGVVMALLLGVLVTGPILIAQFYGRWWAMLPLAPLLLLAHLPALTAAMAAAVLIAAARIPGVVNRFVRGLVALVPPVAAMWISTARTDAGFRSPIERVYLHYPWGGAVLICMLVTLLFWIAVRLLNYRAGAGTIAMGLLIAVTEVTFVYGVGSDELEFRFLDARCGLNSPHFRTESLTEDLDRLTAVQLAESGIANPTPQERAGARGIARTLMQMDGASRLAKSRKTVGEACREFLADFPDSRYVPYVLFLLARSQDMQFDSVGVEMNERLEYSESMVSPAGRETWSRLLVYHGGDPMAVVARVRLAQAYLMEGNIDNGLALLREARQRGEALRHKAQTDPARRSREVFVRRPRLPEALPLIEERIRPVRYWQWLIEENRADGSEDAALSRLFSLDPRQRDYLKNLEAIPRDFPRSQLADNIELLIRLQTREEAKRIQLLRAFIASEDSAAGDAVFQAKAELANLLIKQEEAARKEEARKLWRELLDSGEELFAEEARQGLIGIGELELGTRPPTTSQPR